MNASFEFCKERVQIIINFRLIINADYIKIKKYNYNIPSDSFKYDSVDVINVFWFIDIIINMENLIYEISVIVNLKRY